MAFPAAWPPRPSTGVRSIRFYKTAAATANFSDNAYLFASGLGANTFSPTPYVPPGGETTQAVLGVPPIGAGRDAHDVGSDPRVPQTPPPVAQIWSCGIRVTASGADIEISFDGTNVHGLIKSGASALYYKRYEAGIAFRGAGGTAIVEAW